MTAVGETRKVDCHAHCFDLARHPASGDAGFHVEANEQGSADDFRAVLDAQGISHAVLINPLGGYGTDNSYLLETIAAGGGRLKGVALLAPDSNERQIAALVDGGVVGIRFNLNFPSSPSLFGAAGQRALAIAREVGWLIQIHYSGDALLPALPVLKTQPRVIIDHCGRPDVTQGLDQPGFKQLLEFGRADGAFIKLSAFFRMTRRGGNHDDCDPFIEALLNAYPADRRLWGSDWPFVRASRRVDYGPQLAYAQRLAPDPIEQQMMFWTNPAGLFGFR